MASIEELQPSFERHQAAANRSERTREIYREASAELERCVHGGRISPMSMRVRASASCAARPAMGAFPVAERAPCSR